MYTWPVTDDELEAEQVRVARLAGTVDRWQPPRDRAPLLVAVFIAYPRGLTGAGATGDAAWLGAAAFDGPRMVASKTLRASTGAPYIAGLLALREGPLVEQALRMLDVAPDVALINATGRDHPRRAGLALHVGAVLAIPTIGVTDRPLVASGEEPGARRPASEPLMLEGDVVGYLLRARSNTKPLVVHAGWRTTPDVARDIVVDVTRHSRTPEPLRQARRLARVARSRDAG